MDKYLADFRRRRKLVDNLVQERQRIHQDTLIKQKLAITADRNTRKIQANLYNGAKALELYHKTKLFQQTKIKRLRKIKQQFLQHAATNERKTFLNWVENAKNHKLQRIKTTQENAREHAIETEQRQELERQQYKLAQLVQDAHAPRRKGTNTNKSKEMKMRERLYAAGRAHHETGLLKRVNHYGLCSGFVEEKGRPRPTQLLIRPIPEILDPPHVDRPEYPTVRLISTCQKEDPLLSCVLIYLELPLDERDGQILVQRDINQERQGMTDALLFRNRKDGQGKGWHVHEKEKKIHRKNKQEEYLLTQFQNQNVSLPCTVSKMLRICRPITLDPVKKCLYLTRRPDAPQALSQIHDRQTYLMGGNHSPDDLLKTKLLIVPPR